MSVKVHESFCLDSFQDRLLFFDDFEGDQVKDEWRSGGSAGGASAVVDAQTGGIVRLTTDTDDGDSWLMDWADIRSLLISKKVTMEVRAKASSATYVSIGLQIRFDGNNLVRFYVTETVGGATNWTIVATNGGASTSLDSGIALDTDYHIFRIECFPTDEVHFYIDDVETTNSPITTNIPDDAADYLQPYFWLRAEENAAKSVDIDYVYLRQER